MSTDKAKADAAGRPEDQAKAKGPDPFDLDAFCEPPDYVQSGGVSNMLQGVRASPTSRR